MFKWVEVVVDSLFFIIGWLLNILLVPISLIYSALTAKVDMGDYSISGAKVLYYIWIGNDGTIKFSDKAVSTGCKLLKVFKAHPVAGAAAFILVCIPVILWAAGKIIADVFKSTPKKKEEDTIVYPEIDMPTQELGKAAGRKRGRKAKSIQ